MQTFLPHARFDWCAITLDWRRLGKQRIETLQIIRALTGESSGWRNHPAVHMWDGHVACLAEYGVVMCDEWIRRGYNDTTRAKIAAYMSTEAPAPWWMGDERMHSAHRARLLMKHPKWYSRHGWHEQPSETYWWPTKESE